VSPLIALQDIATVVQGAEPAAVSLLAGGRQLPFVRSIRDLGEKYPCPEAWVTEPEFVAEPGDVLVAFGASECRVNICERSYGVGAAVTLIRRSDPQFPADYLYGLLNAMLKRSSDRFSLLRSAARVRSISTLQVVRHSEQDRQKITLLLSEVETLISLRKSADGELSRLASALAEGLCRMNEPAGTVRVKFSDLIQSVGQSATPGRDLLEAGSGIPAERIRSLDETGIWDRLEFEPCTVSEAALRETAVHAGELLLQISRNDSSPLRSCAVPSEFSRGIVCGRGVVRLRLKENVRAGYVRGYLATAAVQAEIRSGLTRSPSLILDPLKAVAEVVVPVPPCSVQIGFCDRIAEIEQLRMTGFRATTEARQLLQSIASEFFN